MENAIESNSILESDSKLVLSNFIVSTAYLFDEISKSGVFSTDAKLTETAYYKCLQDEMDSNFSNPVKSAQYILGCPWSWCWTMGSCLYDTWNA